MQVPDDVHKRMLSTQAQCKVGDRGDKARYDRSSVRRCLRLGWRGFGEERDAKWSDYFVFVQSGSADVAG